MFATLIIGLREGLEAALIVGIIAAFLRRQGRTDALRWMWVGVGVAVAICVAVAIGLEVLSRDLPQRQQEGLETVIGAIAVVMVTYMIVWMREHARDLKGDLEAAATDAVNEGSAVAFVMMAFLAVLREGLETSVFLVAAFNASHNALPSALGAIIGIGIAVILGYGIYRGGVHINLARFFKVTGLLLALVAAGLVMTAFRTAHEAGWLNVGQQQVVDLTWLVQPGSLQSSLLTGVLGIQPRPVLIEVVGWAVYLLVVGMIVLWPAGKAFPRRAAGLACGALAAVLAVAAIAVLSTAPAQPSAPSDTLRASVSGAPSTSGVLAGRSVRVPDPVSVRIDSADASLATGALTSGTVTTPLPKLTATDDAQIGSTSFPTYQQLVSPNLDIDVLIPDAPARVTPAQVAAGNNGRLPVGLNTQTFGVDASVVYTVTATVTTSVDPTFHTPVAADVHYVVTATATPESGTAVVLGKVAMFDAEHTAGADELAALLQAVDQRSDHHFRSVVLPLWLAGCAVIAAIVACALLLTRRRVDEPDDHEDLQAGALDDPAHTKEKTT